MRPNTPVRGKRPGVAAIDVDGDRYCIDCAEIVLDGEDIGVQYSDNTMDSIRDADGEEIVNGLISGEIYTLSYGGVLLSGAESPHMHCGCGSACVNALEGDEHDYGHDGKVGGRLDLTEVEH